MSGAEIREESSAVVLAGGKSSRMGQPKALLLFDGEPLIVHIVRALRRIFDDLVVVAAPEQELPPLAATNVRDVVPYQGPVGGIYYGLEAAKRNMAFVTSCDAPFLNLPLVSHLLAQMSECDVAVPYWRDRFQPLHAVYRRSVMPLLAQQLERGELRPISLYQRVRTREIREDEILRFDPEGLSFLNMNTPEDYQGALKKWEEMKNPSLACTVELFSVARLLAKTPKVSLALRDGATLADLFSALADELPILVGPVISPDRKSLTRGSACNINGREFVRDPSVKVKAGDNVFILSADAGG